MIIKLTNLTADEFASLAKFLASDKNIIKEHLNEDGSLPHPSNTLELNRATHFATLISSSRDELGHKVVLRLEEVWKKLETIKRGHSWREEARSQPLPGHYVVDLLISTGRYKG